MLNRIFLIAAILLAACGGTDRRGDVVASNTDREFVSKAASASMFEVQSSQVALNEADLGKTKGYARKMIRDHFRANQQLAEIARQRGIAVPMKLLPEHQMLMDQFEGGPAETMDERYHDIQLKAHHDSVDVFENCARTCDDPRLRRFAAKKLPKLRQHFQAAQRAHRRQTAGG